MLMRQARMSAAAGITAVCQIRYGTPAFTSALYRLISFFDHLISSPTPDDADFCAQSADSLRLYQPGRDIV